MATSLSAAALDNEINISQEQIDNLGIKVGPLTASQQIPLLYAPAKVVVPADHELLVSSTLSGLVVQLHANIGDSIEKGQILAQINSPELVNLQREFLTAGNELNLSSQAYQRDKKLLEEGVIAERRWHETQTEHSSKSSQLDTAKQLLLMAGMSAAEIKTLAQTRKLTSLLNIRAPISGVILERSATVGARLDMQAPLYRIADLSELWLEINIPQERLNTIHIGDLTRIEDTAITAKVSLLGQSVNHENQTVLARAVIEGKPAGLRVGQSVNVQLMQNNAQTGYKVPNTAIALNEGHAYIFVRNKDGFAVTEVKVTGKQEAESLINAPLSGNEQIAVKGAVALKANWLHLGSDE
ncbi:MAG: efflux RND transporter periplasmic adaptor subunit [Methylomonas sp.]